MSKLRRDVRIAMLGAAAGLFSVGVFLLFARIDAYYTYLEVRTYAPHYGGVESLWWIPVAFWHVLLSIAASLVAHRYLTSAHASAQFLLWQAIGAFVLLGWALSFFTVVALEGLMSGEINSFSLLYRIDVPSIFKFASSVFASHVMYGSAMHASSREYLEKKSDTLCDGLAELKTHRSFQKNSRPSSLLIDEKQIKGTKN
jgi:hypothetical protein